MKTNTEEREMQIQNLRNTLKSIQECGRLNNYSIVPYGRSRYSLFAAGIDRYPKIENLMPYERMNEFLRGYWTACKNHL